MRPLRYAGPVLLFVAAILAWQGIASTDWFDDLTLASPTEVAHSPWATHVRYRILR